MPARVGPVPGGAAVQPAAQRVYYPGLDFLRGIAAMLVVAYHLGPRIELPWIAPHAYLMVDLFFCMSGFVIGNAYQEALHKRTLSIARFLGARTARLYAMILVGSILGFLTEIILEIHKGSHDISDVMKALFQSCILLPDLDPGNLGPGIFPLNGVFWSLFFEIWANIVFGVLMYAARRPMLWITPIVLFSSIFSLSFIASHGSIEHAGVEFDHFYAGFARVSLSFFCGVLIFRFRDLIRKIPSSISVTTVLALCIANMPTLSSGQNIAFDIFILFVGIPLIVILGAAAHPSKKFSKVAYMSGLMSYPLYALHYPIIRSAGVLIRSVNLSFTHRLILEISLLIVLVIFATGVEYFVERPITRWLKSRLSGKAQTWNRSSLNGLTRTGEDAR